MSCLRYPKLGLSRMQAACGSGKVRCGRRSSSACFDLVVMTPIAPCWAGYGVVDGHGSCCSCALRSVVSSWWTAGPDDATLQPLFVTSHGVHLSADQQILSQERRNRSLNPLAERTRGKRTSTNAVATQTDTRPTGTEPPSPLSAMHTSRFYFGTHTHTHTNP